MNKQKGFTIIELIVVIAIIAVLAAIVLVNVTSYINKGKDAAAQGNLASMLTNYAVFLDQGGTTGYVAQTGATGGATYISALTNAGYTNTSVNTTSDWCTSIVLKADSTKKYCVDSTGAKKMSATATCAGNVCPN